MYNLQRKDYVMLKTKILFLLFLSLIVLVCSDLALADKPTGPFKVKLEISKLPMLNEEVALICTVTSTDNVDSTLVRIFSLDSTMMKIIGGQSSQYCKFKKDETKVFKLTVSFPKEGAFEIAAIVQWIFPEGSGFRNTSELFIKTYKDKKAVLLESLPWKIPDKALRRFSPGLRDSIAARACSLKIKDK